MCPVLFRCLAAAALLCPLLSAQVEPYVESVVNSASYRASDQDGFGIAQGSLFVVFGWNLGPSELIQASAFPLPSVLGGTSIRVSVGSVSASAPMVYSSTYQVAAILPSTIPSGIGSLTLTYNGRADFPYPIRVVRSAFGLYSVASSGLGAGVITTADFQLPSWDQPMKSGDTAVLWGTGLGPVDGNEAGQPLPGNRFPETQVWVGNAAATVEYAGRSGCCAGLDQIVIRIPPGQVGCSVPVAVRSGSILSNFVTAPISAQGSPCSDAVGIPRSVMSSAV